MPQKFEHVVYLSSPGGHIPYTQYTITTESEKALWVWHTAQSDDFWVMSLQFKRSAFASTNIPDDYRIIKTSGEQMLFIWIPF